MPATGKVRFVHFLSVNSTTDAIKYEMLLNRSGVHFMIKNATLQHFFGGGAISTGFNPVTGPIEFHVLEEQLDTARHFFEELYELDRTNIPEECPACTSPVPGSTFDCPECGLFLG